jgi:hypothetical protein
LLAHAENGSLIADRYSPEAGAKRRAKRREFWQDVHADASARRERDHPQSKGFFAGYKHKKP